ncbi:roquin-1-like [Macrosteles quadrilineatus]|uniref:roquin-1-like n=1 Tax=Macrosteles quadrilineatus TaxID=74068 RepID=UPI0023E09E97|nr:roquin-1-like [Macrosteles quadrilineatus]
MPIQAPQWTEFLSCPVCCNEFDATLRSPVSLACAHTVCKTCLVNLHRKQCPFDQTAITTELEKLPVNTALLQLVSPADPPTAPPQPPPLHLAQDDSHAYLQAKTCIEELALYLKPFSSGSGTGVLSRPMQRKLVTLINCQLMEEEGRSRAMRAARSLGERTVTELILQHQNPQQLSANLWAAVRARGCQFLGPAMQEEVLKLVLLALEDGSALSRKVLVMFVVQRLEPHFPQASKTSIGHVVQLLYRASCFKVSKREGDSSLMQLKEEFRTYEALRREHDAQIVQIATEAGLRIAPDQWSALLYGDTAHKSHMQSIIDKLQTPQSFAQSVQELVIALQRTGDPGNLNVLRPHLELLAAIDPSPESSVCSWQEVWQGVEAARLVVAGLVEFIRVHGARKPPGGDGATPAGSHAHNAKYKISLCRDLQLRGSCPRGVNCTFAHSEDELEKYRSKNRKMVPRPGCKEEDFLADSLFSHSDEVIFNTQQHNSFNSNAGVGVRVGDFNSSLFPIKSSPHTTYQPPQQQMFAPTPGTFTPDIYSAAPHSMVLSTGGQLYAPQPDYASTAPPHTDHRPIETAHTQAWLSHLPPPPPNKRYNNKNLVLLQQRKQEIVSQLERNKCNTPLRGDTSSGVSTYSMWNSGGILHTTSGPNSQVSLTSSYRPVLYRSDSVLTDDEFIPFDTPIVSKYGPISRAAAAAKAMMRPQSLQSSAVFGDATISTPGLRRPVPAPSPITPAWPPQYNGYQQPQLVSPPAASPGDYITIGHGIVDPPQIVHRPPLEQSNLMLQLKNIEKQITMLKQQQQYQEMMEKEKEWRFSQLVPNHGGVGVGWSSDGWSSTGYHSDDEDSYDIAHNMRELELTIQGQLEEDDDSKLWPHDDDSAK